MLGCQANVSKITSFPGIMLLSFALTPTTWNHFFTKKKVITTHKSYTLSRHKYAHLYNYDRTVIIIYNNFMTNG